jgi:hypothetical protein
MSLIFRPSWGKRLWAFRTPPNFWRFGRRSDAEARSLMETLCAFAHTCPAFAMMRIALWPGKDRKGN